LGLTIDKSNNIFLATSTSNKLTKVDSSGSFVWDYINIESVNACATDNDGNIYIGGSSKIRKVSPAGVLIWDYATYVPVYAICTDKQNNVYCNTSTGLSKISPNGVRIWAKTIGTTIYGLEVDHLGNVYVTDYAGHIYKINSNGVTIYVYNKTAYATVDVTVDKLGYVYFVSYNLPFLNKLKQI
jgi:ligand-binding sensor domain-containing protein